MDAIISIEASTNNAFIIQYFLQVSLKKSHTNRCDIITQKDADQVAENIGAVGGRSYQVSAMTQQRVNDLIHAAVQAALENHI